MEFEDTAASAGSSKIRQTGLDRALLETALDCIISMDATGHIIEFNPAAERVFGHTRAEALGRELAQLIISEPLRDHHRAGLRRFLETGKSQVLGKRLEVNAVRADGTQIPVELAITVVRVDDEPIFTAYLLDITDRTRGEEASRLL